MKIQVVSSLFFILMFLASCNKDKQYSRRVDDNRWNLTSLSISDTSVTHSFSLKFGACKIYKETCEGSWYGLDGKAKFAWQFREDGKVVEISNQTDHGHKLADVKAAEQCINFSGVYEVLKCSRSKLEITSSNTNGFKGKSVKITLEKE